MSIDRASYTIEFKTTADLAPLEKTLDYMLKMRDAAAQTGQETSVYDAAIDQLSKKLADAQKPTEELADKTKQGAEGFKIFGRGAHEAHAAIDALKQAIPGIGEIIHFLANPITATMGIATIAFSSFKEAAKETMDMLNQLADSPGARGEWAEKEANAVDHAKVEMALWEDQIRRVVDAHETLKQKTDELVEHQTAALQTQNEISQAEKTLADVKVDLAEKLGQISHETALKIKLQIDGQAFKEQAELKVKELEAEINARLKSFAENENQEPSKRAAVEHAQAASDAAEKSKVHNQEKLSQDQKNLQDSIDRQAIAEKQLQDLKDKEPVYGYDKSDPQYYARQAAQNTVDAEQNVQGGLRRATRQEKEKQPGLDVSAGTAAQDLEDAKKAYQDAAQLEKDQQARIKQLQEDLAAAKAKAATLESIHNQTAQTTAAAQSVTPSNIADAQAQAAAAGERGPGASLGARDLVNSLNLLEASMRGQTGRQQQDYLPQLISMLDKMIGYFKNTAVSPAQHEELGNKIEELQRQVDILESTPRSFPGH